MDRQELAEAIEDALELTRDIDGVDVIRYPNPDIEVVRNRDFIFVPATVRVPIKRG